MTPTATPHATPLHSPLLSWNVVLGTSTTKYITGGGIGATVHFFCGATMRDLINVVQQCNPLIICSVALMIILQKFFASLNVKLLIDLIRFEFNSSFLNSSNNSRLINHKLYLKKFSIYKLIYCFPHVISPILIYRRCCFVVMVFIFLILVIAYCHLDFSLISLFVYFTDLAFLLRHPVPLSGQTLCSKCLKNRSRRFLVILMRYLYACPMSWTSICTRTPR